MQPCPIKSDGAGERFLRADLCETFYTPLLQNVPGMPRLTARIRKARESRHLTLAEFARRIGVTPSASFQWEQENGTAPSVQNLTKIAMETGVSFAWLAIGRGSVRLALRAENEFERKMLAVARIVAPNMRAGLQELLGALAILERGSRRPR